MVLQRWRLRQADGEVLAEKEGCVGIKMYWHGRGEGEVNNDNEGEGRVAEYGG